MYGSDNMWLRWWSMDSLLWAQGGKCITQPLEKYSRMGIDHSKGSHSVLTQQAKTGHYVFVIWSFLFGQTSLDKQV